jgi:drug/metabolite transporter (DMT)-like permease
MTNKHQAEVALVAVAAIWGLTFVLVKDAVQDYPVYAFNALRFVLALVVFSIVCPRSYRKLNRSTILVGSLAGMFLAGGYIFQTLGLRLTTVSSAGFITGMTVVITPLLQVLILRRVPRPTVLAGVVLSVIGLWLMTNPTLGGWNAGNWLVLLCALAYSCQMIVLGGLGKNHDAASLTLVQLVVVAAVSTLLSLLFEKPQVPQGAMTWIALLVTGVLASAVAFFVLTWALRCLSPTRTSLILVLEPVFAGIAGNIFMGDRLGAVGILGCVLITFGMLAAVFSPARVKRSQMDDLLSEPPVQSDEARLDEGPA